MYKLIVLSALVAVASAGFAPIAYHAPAVAYHAPAVAYHAPIAVKVEAPKPAPAKPAAPKEDEEFDANPAYSFSYDVSDAETGDTKTQSESLENGVVKGSYSVVDPDGVKRTVEYTADAVNGFNAVVNTEPSNVVIKAPVVKAVAPAPVAVKAVAAPAVYHAPAVAYHAPAVYHSAPIAYHSAPAVAYHAAPVAAKVVSSPLSYSTSHFSYHPQTVALAAAPVHHKVIY